MKAFLGPNLDEHLQSRKNHLIARVHSEDKNYLLNVSAESYVDFLVDNYYIQPLQILFDGKTVSLSEKMIPAERFPSLVFNVVEGKSYKKQVITYHIPYAGTADLIRMSPSSRLTWTVEIGISDDAISFDVIDWRNDSAEIQREADRYIKNLRTNAGFVREEVNKFNDELQEFALSTLNNRKQEILRQSSLLESLGVPIRKSKDVPRTFAIPPPRKKAVVRPQASTTPFSPEPTLEDSTYQEILRLIFDILVAMERHPATYRDKDEETLRDHLLMVLSPQYDSATGETFNKIGKTDILIRHDKKNAFVAECKFWTGREALIKTIDQALGYLTWRDSKAALILFIKNKGFTEVLEKIKAAIPEHDCHLRTKEPTEETWFNYDFHLPGDEAREVRLAVIACHIPRT